MDNAAKALQIAGAVLLAVIILSFIVYSFKQFGKMPQAQDEQMSAEQLAKFNQEFAVYKKSKMYGVDVISCLNKVQNYNDKYVLNVNDGQQTSGGFYTGTSKYGNEFKMDVRVAIGKQLSENVVIDKMLPSGREVEIGFGDAINDDTSLTSLGFKVEGGYTNLKPDCRVMELPDKIKNDEIGVLRDTGGIHLLGTNDDLSNPENYCSLLYGNDDGNSNRATLVDAPNLNNDAAVDPNNSKNNPLVMLLKYSDKFMKQTITNRGNNVPVTEWSRITWETALYDFKKRRFTCENMHYNEETGQIDIIIFKEVK